MGTLVAQRKGFECDTCSKTASGSMFGLAPDSWFQVYPANHFRDALCFCSKECFVAFALGKARVELPERPSVLFIKFLKAVFN